MMLTIWSDPVAVAGIISAVTGAILGFLAYRRTGRMDAAANEAAEETLNAGRVTQVVKGLESVIKGLQDDNKALRDYQGRLERRVERLEQQIRELRNGKGNGKP